MPVVVTLCGLVALVLGTWRSYAVAREALSPLVHEGDPTRTAIEAARPVHARFRIRLFARRVAISIGWLIVALYGLFLVSAASAASVAR
jgi:hypothetical protein